MLFALVYLAPFTCCPEMLFSFHVACSASGSLYLMGANTFVGLGSSAQNSVFIVGFRTLIVSFLQWLLS